MSKLAMTSLLPRFWADLKTTDFAQLDAARSIAVLPLAATEQHGPHLPLSVDTDLVNGVVAHALAHLPAGLPVFFCRRKRWAAAWSTRPLPGR